MLVGSRVCGGSRKSAFNTPRNVISVSETQNFGARLLWAWILSHVFFRDLRGNTALDICPSQRGREWRGRQGAPAPPEYFTFLWADPVLTPLPPRSDLNSVTSLQQPMQPNTNAFLLLHPSNSDCFEQSFYGCPNPAYQFGQGNVICTDCFFCILPKKTYCQKKLIWSGFPPMTVVDDVNGMELIIREHN